VACRAGFALDGGAHRTGTAESGAERGGLPIAAVQFPILKGIRRPRATMVVMAGHGRSRAVEACGRLALAAEDWFLVSYRTLAAALSGVLGPRLFR
jgi:hypothetical protein